MRQLSNRQRKELLGMDVRNFLAESRYVTQGTDECDGDKPDDNQRKTAQPGRDVAEPGLVCAVLHQ